MFEIFKNEDNVHNYYCNNASDYRLLNELSVFLRDRKAEKGIIVLDDCNADAFSQICKLQLEIETFYKIIGIYNDTDDIVRQDCYSNFFMLLWLGQKQHCSNAWLS